jgi:hypothetical protein
LGLSILVHYLIGGGTDMKIRNDPLWTQYVMANPLLRKIMEERETIATGIAVANYIAVGAETTEFSYASPAEIQNGSGFDGYGDMHGTDNFAYQAHAAVAPNVDGTYRVTLDNTYTWNDTMDRNKNYAADEANNSLAETLTHGYAESYKFQLTWQTTSTLTVDKNGGVLADRSTFDTPRGVNPVLDHVCTAWGC